MPVPSFTATPYNFTAPFLTGKCKYRSLASTSVYTATTVRLTTRSRIHPHFFFFFFLFSIFSSQTLEDRSRPATTSSWFGPGCPTGRLRRPANGSWNPSASQSPGRRWRAHTLSREYRHRCGSARASSLNTRYGTLGCSKTWPWGTHWDGGLPLFFYLPALLPVEAGRGVGRVWLSMTRLCSLRSNGR